jgi:uncharacterized protein (DUF302 family)
VNDPTEAEVVEHISTVAFEPTVERIVKGIADAGLILFARIDHAAGAHDAGLSMPPATLLIYGHAKGGTPITLASPHAALDLPLRVLVREREDGHAVIAFHPVVPMLRRAGVPDELSARLEPAQRLLLEAVAS